MFPPPLVSTVGWPVGTPNTVLVETVLPPCYANCDGSTIPPVLNVADYHCFVNRFSSGDPWANCDDSTIPPVLNINDYICFQRRFLDPCGPLTDSLLSRGSSLVSFSCGIVNPCHAYGGAAGVSVLGPLLRIRIAPNIAPDGLPTVVIESAEVPVIITWDDALGPHLISYAP